MQNHPTSARYAIEHALEVAKGDGSGAEKFAAWQHSAALSPHAALGLSQMSVVINAQLVFLEDGPIPLESAPAGTPNALTSPLVNNADYLLELDDAVSREIEKRISGVGFAWSNVEIATSIRDCILDGAMHCVAMLDDYRGWMRAGMANTHAPREARSIMALSLAKIQAADGKSDESIELLHKAIGYDPTSLQIHFELVLLQLTLENLEAAKQALENAERLVQRTGYRARELKNLKLHYADLEAKLAGAKKQD